MSVEESKPILIAIDDQKFYLDEIGYEVEDQNILYRPFEGPSAFEEEASREEVNQARLILIDYDFRTCTTIDRDLVGLIRENYPNFSGKIVLLSLLDDFMSDNEAIRQKFDGVINKKDLSWERLAAYLN